MRRTEMSHAAKSIFVFGLYVLAAGLTLLLAPNLALPVVIPPLVVPTT